MSEHYFNSNILSILKPKIVVFSLNHLYFFNLRIELKCNFLGLLKKTVPINYNLILAKRQIFSTFLTFPFRSFFQMYSCIWALESSSDDDKISNRKEKRIVFLNDKVSQSFFIAIHKVILSWNSKRKDIEFLVFVLFRQAKELSVCHK